MTETLRSRDIHCSVGLCARMELVTTATHALFPPRQCHSIAAAILSSHPAVCYVFISYCNILGFLSFKKPQIMTFLLTGMSSEYLFEKKHPRLITQPLTLIPLSYVNAPPPPPPPNPPPSPTPTPYLHPVSISRRFLKIVIVCFSIGIFKNNFFFLGGGVGAGGGGGWVGFVFLLLGVFVGFLHDWCNKGRGMCYPVCGMVHIKEPLLLIGKSSLCGGSGFPFSLS